MNPRWIVFLFVFFVTVTLLGHTGYGTEWNLQELVFGEMR